MDTDVYNELRGTGAFDTMTVDEDEVGGRGGGWE